MGIIKILEYLKNSSPGWDEISPYVVKMTFNLFLKPLHHICNLSILHGIFPMNLNSQGNPLIQRWRLHATSEL